MASTKSTPISALVSAVWAHIGITDIAVAAMRAAGAETDEVKDVVLATYMARRMNPKAKACTEDMLNEARAVLALPGASTKAEQKRTVEQERFYTGARQYLFALRKKAEVEASDNRGGANNTGPRAPRPGSNEGDGQDIPIAPPATTKYETEADVRRHLAHMTATALAFIDKHADVTGMQTRKVVLRWVKDTAGWGAAEKK